MNQSMQPIQYSQFESKPNSNTQSQKQKTLQSTNFQKRNTNYIQKLQERKKEQKLQEEMKKTQQE